MAEKGLKFNVDVSDDQLMQAIFLPGFSSRDEAGEFSGRGVGMDAIKDEVTNLGGRVYVESRVGKGTRLIIDVPDVTLEEVQTPLAA